MSQQTFSPGGTQVAEPPAPVLPVNDADHGGDDNRRKLMLVGGAVGVLVLALVAFFLLKGGGSSGSSDSSFAVPHHHKVTAPAAPAQAPVVKLPKKVAAPVGRDPFKALYTAPQPGGGAAGGGAAAGSTTSTSTGTSSTQQSGGTSSTPTTTTTGGSTTTAPAPKPTYHPVWVQLRSVSSTSATFDVGYSNGKTLKAVRYSGVKVQHTFASNFELLSIHNGVATLKYGDGSPFQLDRSHNTMVVG